MREHAKLPGVIAEAVEFDQAAGLRCRANFLRLRVSRFRSGSPGGLSGGSVFDRELI
jgi:hypothetical protein